MTVSLMSRTGVALVVLFGLAAEVAIARPPKGPPRALSDAELTRRIVACGHGRRFAVCDDRRVKVDLDRRTLVPGDRQVASVALAVLASPDTDGSTASIAYEIAAWWLRGPADAGRYDEATQQWFSAGLRVALANGSAAAWRLGITFLLGKAYLPIPGAREMLLDEVANQHRTTEERVAAANALAEYQVDLSLVKEWCERSEPIYWEMALALLMEIDHVDGTMQRQLIERLKLTEAYRRHHRKIAPVGEAGLLRALALRPDLSENAAIRLLFHVSDEHRDPTMVPILQPLTSHASAAVRAEAVQAVRLLSELGAR